MTPERVFCFQIGGAGLSGNVTRRENYFGGLKKKTTRRGGHLAYLPVTWLNLA